MQWIENYKILMLRITLSIIFIWFGALKIAGISPAQELIEKTVYWFPANIFIPFLGWCEVAIGIGLLIRKILTFTITVLLLHMICTFLPLIIIPEACFTVIPYGLTLAGQYIIKNIVFLAAILIILGMPAAKHKKSNLTSSHYV